MIAKPSPDCKLYFEQLTNEGFRRVLTRVYQAQQSPYEFVMLTMWISNLGKNSRMLMDDGKKCAIWEKVL